MRTDKKTGQTKATISLFDVNNKNKKYSPRCPFLWNFKCLAKCDFNL